MVFLTSHKYSHVEVKVYLKLKLFCPLIDKTENKQHHQLTDQRAFCIGDSK